MREAHGRFGSLALFMVTAVLCACPESRYSGDGELTDDRFSPSERFVLTLGPTDLTKPVTSTYRLAGLPKDHFVVGFAVSDGSSTGMALHETRPIKAVIRLTLTDEYSRVVIDETGPLNEWTWSGSPHGKVSFVYKQGKSRDLPMPGGYVTPQPLDVKQDEGWGSAFMPRPDGEYSLRVQVLKGDALANAYNVTLRSASGGWE
jgi:hypothetical protein